MFIRYIVPIVEALLSLLARRCRINVVEYLLHLFQMRKNNANKLAKLFPKISFHITLIILNGKPLKRQKLCGQQIMIAISVHFVLILC